MYDYSKFAAELAGNQAPYGAYTGQQATLYLFSPKVFPTQVLRPYQYNFTPEFENDVLNGATSLQAAIAPNHNGAKDSVVNAILPTTQGILMNTTDLSMSWSFVLFIDSNTVGSGSRMAMPNTNLRQIASGYITGIDVTCEEPINPLTGTVNNRAVLVFTHTSMARMGNDIGMRGYNPSLTVLGDADVITPAAGAMVGPNDTLYLGMAGDLMCNTDYSSPDHPVSSMGGLVVSDATMTNGYKTVGGEQRSPKHQLSTIMRSMDRALDNHHEEIRSFISPVQPEPEDTQILNNFSANLPNSNAQLPKLGLDTNQPITMGELTRVFPNIVIQPIHIPNQGAWGVAPQDRLTRKNQMSALVSSTVSTIAEELGLANVNFRYNSWMKSGVGEYGQWELIEPIAMLVTTSADLIKIALRKFMNVLELELFPILKSVGGEFDLIVFCNLAGEILINLNYYDSFTGNGIDALDGVYETNGRLGGLLNPMMGTLPIVNSNMLSLMTFARDTIDAKVGAGAYMLPNSPELELFNHQPVYNASEPTWHNDQPPFLNGNQLEPTPSDLSPYII